MERVPVFRFPSQKTEPEERQAWIKQVKQVNANLTVSDNTVVFEAHWPKDYRTTRKKGADRPAEAPTVFPGKAQHSTG